MPELYWFCGFLVVLLFVTMKTSQCDCYFPNMLVCTGLRGFGCPALFVIKNYRR